MKSELSSIKLNKMLEQIWPISDSAKFLKLYMESKTILIQRFGKNLC